MIKKTINYTDFLGTARSEEFFFNLTESELTKMEITTNGGYGAYLQQISASKDNKKIYEAFEEIIHVSYGVLSPDGTRFVKTEEAWQEFRSSAAFNELMMSFFTDEKVAGEFAAGIMPSSLQSKVAEAQAKPGFRPGAQTLPQSEIDKRAAAAAPQQFQAPIVPTTPESEVKTSPQADFDAPQYAETMNEQQYQQYLRDQNRQAEAPPQPYNQ